MKKTIVWEADDIVVGRYYFKDSETYTHPLAEYSAETLRYFSSTAHKIGFLPWMDKDDRYVSCSINDGMSSNPMTKEQLAKVLNDNGYVPLPTDLLVRLIERNRHQNEGVQVSLVAPIVKTVAG